jgi:hypothetical protein
MKKTDSQLLTEAGVIRNEQTAKANTADRVGEMLEDIIDSKLNASYKVYTALFNQGSIYAPTVTVLENTIGTIIWTYSTIGTYYGTLTGAFAGTVPTIIGPMGHEGNPYFGESWGSYYGINKVSSNQILLRTGTPGNGNSDNLLWDQFIEIRVYN